VRNYIIALIVLIVDQWTKWLVVKKMELRESIPLINDFLFLTSHRNKGAAFGILQGQMWLFFIITVVVVVGIVYYMKTYRENKPLGIALGLILGGAIGNLIDRVWRGEVVDFIDVLIINYDFPIFNVADSALVIGVGLIFILTLFEGKKKGEA
jgi:signal peptidase II